MITANGLCHESKVTIDLNHFILLASQVTTPSVKWRIMLFWPWNVSIYVVSPQTTVKEVHYSGAIHSSIISDPGTAWSHDLSCDTV